MILYTTNIPTHLEIEIIQCTNVMWEMFCQTEQSKESIQKFLEAKERIHQLLAFYCLLRPEIHSEGIC